MKVSTVINEMLRTLPSWFSSLEIWSGVLCKISRSPHFWLWLTDWTNFYSGYRPTDAKYFPFVCSRCKFSTSRFHACGHCRTL